jgi:hypothetical protein
MAARRYSRALQSLTFNCCMTSATVTHAVMPAGRGRSGVAFGGDFDASFAAS